MLTKKKTIGSHVASKSRQGEVVDYVRAVHNYRLAATFADDAVAQFFVGTNLHSPPALPTLFPPPAC